MSADNKQGELLQETFTHAMPYEWSIGLYGSKFFQEIKEKDKKLMKIIIKRSLNQGLSYDFDDYNKILSGEVGLNDKD